MEEDLKRALKQLPNEKEIPEILKNISTLGKESQLEFALFRPKPEEPQQFYAKVPIELTMVGSYHNTGTFFDRVSKLSRIINVVDFSMTRAKERARGREGTEEVSVRTSCMINTYRFIERKGEEKKSEKKTVGKGAEDGLPKAKSKLLSVSMVAFFLLLSCGEGTAPVSVPKKGTFLPPTRRRRRLQRRRRKRKRKRRRFIPIVPPASPILLSRFFN